jgi:hypothetical protein
VNFLLQRSHLRWLRPTMTLITSTEKGYFPASPSPRSRSGEGEAAATPPQRAT